MRQAKRPWRSPGVAARVLASALAALVMAGCAVGPNYRRPPIDAPVATRGQVRPADPASIADLPWWQVFEDPVLQQLVATAIRENYDLKTAAARVEQSRQLIGVARAEVLETLANVMLWRGIPDHIRADNGPEFIATELRTWLPTLGARTLYITQGSPWENGYCESFNGKLRDECLNGEIFYSLKGAQIVIEQWRVQYNTRRPHSSLGYRPPAPEAYHPVSSTNAIQQPLAVM